MIENLVIKNFKSLREVDIPLKGMNLLIGANGTGKTNFADALAFLATTARVGFNEALDREPAGIESVRTRYTKKPSSLSFFVQIGTDESRGIVEGSYEFKLKNQLIPVVSYERLSAVVFKRTRGGKRQIRGVPNFDQKSKLTVGFTRDSEMVTTWDGDIGPKPDGLDESELVLYDYRHIGPIKTISDYLGAIKVYNIDAALVKQGRGTGEQELSRYGDNLPFFLKKALQNDRVKKNILSDIREAVPYIKDIQTERVFNTQTIKVIESDTKNEFYAQDISDGTIRLLGLLAVMHQGSPPPFMVIEEPENAIHQYAIGILIRALEAISERPGFPVQTVLTSHSPAVVDEILTENKPGDIGKVGCFVARRERTHATIESAPTAVIKSISKNIGRPSDFLRENAFKDKPNTEVLFEEEPDAEGDGEPCG